MRYTVRSISLFSALRVGCALGWLIALCPAIGLAWLIGQVIQRLSESVSKVETFNLEVFGQPIATLDLMQLLGLSNAASTISELAANLGATVILLSLVLLAVGALAVALTVLLFCLGYNLLAAIGGGIKVELRPEEQRR
jgi:hypothetical protein